jgi:hypothetical protein
MGLTIEARITAGLPLRGTTLGVERKKECVTQAHEFVAALFSRITKADSSGAFITGVLEDLRSVYEYDDSVVLQGGTVKKLRVDFETVKIGISRLRERTLQEFEPHIERVAGQSVFVDRAPVSGKHRLCLTLDGIKIYAGEELSPITARELSRLSAKPADLFKEFMQRIRDELIPEEPWDIERLLSANSVS